MDKGYTEKIFEIIKDIGYLLPGFESKHEYLKRIRRATYYGTITRLEKRGLVRKEKQGKTIKVVLTEKGKKFHFYPRLLRLERREDNLATIIIFDIPEKYKRERQYFRRKLVQNNFVLIQKSVLLSPNKYPDQLLELEKQLKISKYVTHLSGQVDYIN